MPEVAGGPVTGAIPGPDAISRSRVASAAVDRQPPSPTSGALSSISGRRRIAARTGSSLVVTRIATRSDVLA